LQNSITDLTEENTGFKEQLEIANNILGESEKKAVGLLNLQELAPAAVATSNLVKGKTLTEIITTLHENLQKNEDNVAVIDNLNQNLESLTQQALKFRPFALQLQDKNGKLEEENAELVSQLDISHRDLLSYRTQADDLLVENQKFKRTIQRRERETEDLTDQIARYVNQHLNNLDTTSGQANLTFSSSDIPELPSLFQIQQVISENVSLQRRVEDYTEKLQELLEAADDSDRRF